MSESREKKLRYNRKLEFISHFDEWLATEPPIWRIFSWRKWKKARPIYNAEV